MDELEAKIAAIEPPVEPQAAARVWRRVDRRRRTEPERARSRRSTVAALTAAVLLGAFAAGGTVAAAANGGAPEPVSRALTGIGVLPEPVADPDDEQHEGLIARTTSADADGLVQVVILNAPQEITQIELRLPDGSATTLTSTTETDPTAFLGRLPAEQADGAVVVGKTADGTAVFRALLSDAEQVARDLEADRDERGERP